MRQHLDVNHLSQSTQNVVVVVSLIYAHVPKVKFVEDFVSHVLHFRNHLIVCDEDKINDFGIIVLHPEVVQVEGVVFGCIVGKVFVFD